MGTEDKTGAETGVVTEFVERVMKRARIKLTKSVMTMVTIRVSV